MQIFRLAAVVAFSAVGLPFAAQAAAPPLTFNVAVKVTNLLAEVTDVAVKCSLIDNTASRYASGEAQAPVVSGGFDGVIPVAINGAFTVQQLLAKQQLTWECDLFAVNVDGSEQLVGGLSSPPWSAAAAGDKTVNAIGGDFPPGQVVPMDPKTHTAIK